jgi:hypothetical protein
MASTIRLTLGAPQDKLHPTSFIASIRNFWGILQNVDAAISADPRGSVAWEIVGLAKGSPAQVVFGAGSVLPNIDHSPEIIAAVISGIELLERTAERPPAYSDKTLENLKKLAEQRKRLSEIAVSSNGRSVEVRPIILDSIDRLTGNRFESLGSVVGSLDSITIHRGSEFRVWNEFGGKPVTCRFSGDEMLLEIKGHLGKRVLVYGNMRYNSLGEPYLIQVDGLDSYPEVSELPTIERMSGRVRGITDGLSLGEYLKELRDAG